MRKQRVSLRPCCVFIIFKVFTAHGRGRRRRACWARARAAPAPPATGRDETAPLAPGGRCCVAAGGLSACRGRTGEASRQGMSEGAAQKGTVGGALQERGCTGCSQRGCQHDPGCMGRRVPACTTQATKQQQQPRMHHPASWHRRPPASPDLPAPEPVLPLAPPKQLLLRRLLRLLCM